MGGERFQFEISDMKVLIAEDDVVTLTAVTQLVENYNRALSAAKVTAALVH